MPIQEGFENLEFSKLHKEKMIKQKKAIVVEALMRIIIMAFLIWVVFNIGKRAAEAAFGGSDALQSFEKFVDEINSLGDGGGKQTLLSLDKGTAVMGFSKDKDYQCYGCGAAEKDKLAARFKHPLDSECKDSSCVCLCPKNSLKTTRRQTVLEMSCEKLKCKRLDFDIYQNVKLGDLIAKKYGKYVYDMDSSWQGGFFYARGDLGNIEFAIISGLPKVYAMERKQVIFIEKKKINQEIYVSACPASPCIQEEKIKQ